MRAGADGALSRRRTAGLAVACVWIVACACSGVSGFRPGAGPGGVRGPVKVALVDVLGGTSGYESLGRDVQNSLQIEIDQLNAHGGLLGSPVQLVTFDDQYSPTTTAAVTQQALADPSVRLLVGPSFAGLYLGAKPLVDRRGVPNCLTSMDADDVMTNAPYSFREQEPARARLPALLGYMQRSTQLKKIGLIAEEDSVGQDADQELTDLAGRYGLQYIGAAFTATTPDQRSQVQQMLQRGADAVLVSENPATAGRTLQAIAQLKAGGRLHPFGLNALGPAGLGSYGFAQQLGDPAGGLVFASSILDYLSDVPDARWSPAYRDFVRTALSRFPPTDGGDMRAVAAGAECVSDWARAVLAANSLDGTLVARAWERLDVPAAESVLGVHERFSPADHDAVPADSIFVYQWVKNGDRWGLKRLAGPPG